MRQFEEKVARDEVLIRNRNGGFEGGSGSDAAFQAQTDVNDQYIMAIEAKLKILDKSREQDKCADVPMTHYWVVIFQT